MGSVLYQDSCCSDALCNESLSHLPNVVILLNSQNGHDEVMG